MDASLKSRLTIVLVSLGLAAAASAQQPTFVTSYIMQPAGNQLAIGNGGTLTFPATNQNSTSTATFVVSNTGTAPGVIQSVAISGSAFKISGLTLMPATVAPNGDLRFNVSFTPTSRGPSSGAMTVAIGGSSPITIHLAGTATGASLNYTVTVGAQNQPLSPGATITLPSTPVGSSVSAAVTVTNAGDATATIGSVNVVGAGFSVAAVPPTPATVLSGSSFTFTLVFRPQASGTASGTLLIDSASFPVKAQAVGASLSYSSVIGSTSTALADNGTLSFPNTNIGATSTVAILVTNTGNAPATINGITVSGNGFKLPDLPPLPATLNAGASLQFHVAFTASNTASVSGVLQIDGFGVNLRGNGNPPPALSKVSFGDLPTTANALQQPLVALGLDKPYPIDITGNLTLTFASDSFADDPNIQFSTGGRTVSFTIPANTTDAIFGGSSKSVQFQTGTVSGVITISASLSVASVDLTPSPAPSAKVTVAAAPPVIRSVQLGARTANSFELLVTGLSTPRQVSQIKLQFTPASGANLQTANLFVDTDAPFSTWFQSQTGIGFGSQFTASVIVNVNGDVNAVQSVSVTATNARGDSNAVSVNLR